MTDRGRFDGKLHCGTDCERRALCETVTIVVPVTRSSSSAGNKDPRCDFIRENFDEIVFPLAWRLKYNQIYSLIQGLSRRGEKEDRLALKKIIKSNHSSTVI